MFVSYRYCYQYRNNNVEYKLIDSEFKELFIARFSEFQRGAYASYNADIFAPIVSIYNKKHLNVAANLALLIKYCEKYYKSISKLEYFKILYEQNSLVASYKNDIEKYLLLL